MGRLSVSIAAILLVLATGACGVVSDEPYIYKANEFNRDAANFGEELTDRDSVAICYRKRGTTPETVRSMAETECGRFEKVAVFNSQDLLTCPIGTPVRATFLCVDPQTATPRLPRR